MIKSEYRHETTSTTNELIWPPSPPSVLHFHEYGRPGRNGVPYTCYTYPYMHEERWPGKWTIDYVPARRPMAPIFGAAECPAYCRCCCRKDCPPDACNRKFIGDYVAFNHD